MSAPDPYLSGCLAAIAERLRALDGRLEDIETVLSVIDVRTERALVLLGEPIREVDEEDEEPSFPEWINQPPETAREGVTLGNANHNRVTVWSPKLHPAGRRGEAGMVKMCEVHYTIFEAEGALEDWQEAKRLLLPWVDAARVVGHHELLVAMDESLERVEQEIERAREELEEARAAL